MRILHLMAGANVGGAETFFGRLVLSLQKQEMKQKLIIRPASVREKMLKERSVEYNTAPFAGWFDFTTSKNIKQEISVYGPDIIISWMNRPTRFVPQKFAGGKRNFIHLGSPRGYYAAKYYKNCDHLVVTTNDLAKFYCDQGRTMDQISIIPNFVPENLSKPVLRSKFNTPENVPLLLALGRLHNNKGFDILLNAMIDLPNHYLWLGGAGPLEKELRSIASKNGVAERVRFLGWVDDPASLFRAADIFVCSSRHEPFGNIIIEAWLNSVPIVAAASEGPTSLIENGETGLLVSNEDAEALSAAIGSLSGDPMLMERLSVAGRSRYEDSFTEEQVVGQYVDLFKRLVN